MVVLVGLLAGAWVGDDDNFPFGPFRMYSTRNSLDGHVNAPLFRGVTEDGDEVTVSFEALGLRRAEVDGQFDRLVEDTDLLGKLVLAREEMTPDEPRLVELHLYRRTTDLEGGRPAGEEEVLVAIWRRP